MSETNELLAKAESRIKALRKSDIVEMKAYKSPPRAVVMISEALCILFATQPSYQNFLKLTSRADFIQLLVDYNTQAISDYTLEQLEKYISDPDFNEDYISKISYSAGQLCAWVKLIYEFGKVYSSVSSLNW